MERFIQEAVEIEVKYEGYVRREMELMDRVQAQESKAIPANFTYGDVSGLSIEVVERLQRVKPATLGQAMRIPGITPSAGALLFVHLERGPRKAPVSSPSSHA
jgi:tRNA uridine 5-carboxymethylaminomethyl modification enzyme